MSERDARFDNLKAILIFLVTLGHVMEGLCAGQETELLYLMIYSFHMPLFIFISGYFSQKPDVAGGAAADCLVPYIVFNAAFSMISYEKLLINIFLPAHIYWYMLSLFFWRLLLGTARRFRFAVPASFALSIYAGCFELVNMYLSASRTVAFFPFFLLGAVCGGGLLEKLEKIPKILAAAGLAAVFFGVYGLSLADGFVKNIFYAAQSYEALGLGRGEGALLRLAFYACAVPAGACVLILAPKRRNFLTFIGERTVAIYLLQPFILKYLFRFLSARGIAQALLAARPRISLTAAAGFAAVIVLLCASPPVYKGYRLLFGAVNKILLKRASA